MKSGSGMSRTQSAALTGAPQMFGTPCCQMLLLTAVLTIGCVCPHIRDTEQRFLI